MEEEVFQTVVLEKLDIHLQKKKKDVLSWRKKGKLLGHSGMTWIKTLTIIQWKWQIDLRD